MSYEQQRWIATFVDRVMAMLAYADPADRVGLTLGARPDETDPPAEGA